MSLLTSTPLRVTESIFSKDINQIGSIMWETLYKLATSNDDERLVKECFDRCHQAFLEIYEYEEGRSLSLWKSDHRYFELAMSMMYERYCYAMALIADQIAEEFVDMSSDKYSIPFVASLSKCTDILFEHKVGSIPFHEGVYYYYFEEYNDEHDGFWEQNWKIAQDIAEVRESFTAEDRLWKYGFGVEEDDLDQDMWTWNKDFLFMQRAMSIAEGIDVELFLTATKREYLPMIIDAFAKTQLTISTSPKKKWWHFWS